jgi:hypothetical protein
MFFTNSRQGLLIGFLTIAGVALTGCSGGGGGGGGARVYLDWLIYDLEDTAGTTPRTCGQVGAGNVELLLTSNATSRQFVTTMSCASGAGYSDYVPPGIYDIDVYLYGDSAEYGNSSTLIDQVFYDQPVDLYNGVYDLGEPVVFSPNSFVLEWYITNRGQEVNCLDMGGDSIELDVYFQGQSQPMVSLFPCSDATRYYSLSIPYGSYPVQWQAVLLDANRQDLTTVTPLKTYNVTAGVQADLGIVTFAF